MDEINKKMVLHWFLGKEFHKTKETSSFR